MPSEPPALHAPARLLAAVEHLNVTVRMPDGEPALILDDVSMNFASGRCVGIVGESGSGKTTLGRVLAGLPGPGLTVEGSVRSHPRTGFMFQDAVSALNPVRRVSWQVDEALRARGVPRAERAALRLEYLAMAEVPEPEALQRRYPHELSGGLAQRVLLATVLAGQPELIIADEPTSALDASTQSQIVALLRRLMDEQHLGIMLITHDLAVAAHTCDELVVLYGGQIVEHGPTDQVLRTPAHPYTAALLRALPSFDRPPGHLMPVPGAPPRVSSDRPPCPFSPRCERATDLCHLERPRQIRRTGTTVLCHHPIGAPA
ncbi:ABC transporter ATP-binding protein [Nonomuraea sp. M3C6]|uniref:ABC transporter ATP-binding protein n=1 Tax=Nonomuraea marmarensis TaxID=3351344 RepID=A0ABW7AY25_9ACTN